MSEGLWRYILNIVTALNSNAMNPPSDLRNTGNTETVLGSKSKKRGAREVEVQLPKKRKKIKSSKFVDSDEDYEVQGGPSRGSSSKGKGKARAQVQPEASQKPEAPEASKVSNDVY